MIIAYHSGGARDFELSDLVLSNVEWQRLKINVLALLEARNQNRAHEILSTINFEFYTATNYFLDEFNVLYISYSVEDYVELEREGINLEDDTAYRQIARAFIDRGQFVRFIAFDIADNLEIEPVENPNPQITSDIINRALTDAEVLIATADAVSAVDRIHTAIHGYLQAVCNETQIEYPEDANVMRLYRCLRENHPALNETGQREEEINRILRAISTIIDTVNFLRNRASIAHPNESLLDESEAMLVINSVRTLMNYLNSKF